MFQVSDIFYNQKILQRWFSDLIALLWKY